MASINLTPVDTATTSKKESKDTRRRVKVYILNEKRTWEDRGTGHVTCSFVDRLKGLALVVRSEADNSVALESKILADTAYQKQQETLIVWSEGDSCDLALSFQEKAGCEEIWERICEIQGKDPSVEITQDQGYENESDNENGSPENQLPFGASGSSAPLALQLPPCELSRLNEINELISNSFSTPLLRDALVAALESQGYIKRLLELFRMCEDLDNRESLHLVYRIFMNIFMLNKNALFEILFSEENLKDVIGVFEYDPSVTAVNQESRKHREYLYEQATFKEIIPITNSELKTKIHQTYRVQYIQDFILPAPSIFEENLLSTLSSFIFFNKVEIVSLIQDDEKFLNELFERLTSGTISIEHKRDLALFLKEFCSFSQKLQPQARDNFFRGLTNHGILKAIENCFQTNDEQTRLATIEILSHVVDYNASLVRDYALQQTRNAITTKKRSNLLNVIIDQLFYEDENDPEIAASLQLAGILKILIDPENMMSTTIPKSDKSEFLAFFYKNCVMNLVAPLHMCTHEDKLTKDDYRTAHVLSLILDLLTFCIEHHLYQARTYAINKSLLKTILVLLKSRHKFLALGALRLFRRIVHLKDDMYNRHIVRERLLESVAKCFKQNGPRYNLLNSALLELFEFIRTEDISVLVSDIVDNYFKYFDDVDYCKTFASLKLRYEQFMERQKNKSLIYDEPLNNSSANMWRQRRDMRDMDEDEEQWFNEVESDDWDDDLPASVELSVVTKPLGDTVITTQSPGAIITTSPIPPNKSSSLSPIASGPTSGSSGVITMATATSGSHGILSSVISGGGTTISSSSSSSMTTVSSSKQLQQHQQPQLVTLTTLNYDDPPSDEENTVKISATTDWENDLPSIVKKDETDSDDINANRPIVLTPRPNQKIVIKSITSMSFTVSGNASSSTSSSTTSSSSSSSPAVIECSSSVTNATVGPGGQSSSSMQQHNPVSTNAVIRSASPLLASVSAPTSPLPGRKGLVDYDDDSDDEDSETTVSDPGPIVVVTNKSSKDIVESVRKISHDETPTAKRPKLDNE